VVNVTAMDGAFELEPPSADAGPTPVTAAFDARWIGVDPATLLAEGTVQRVRLRGLAVGPGGDEREIPLQFQPAGDDPHTTAGELTWLADPSTKRVRLTAERESVGLVESVTSFPFIVAGAFPRHQVVPGYGTTIGVEVDGREIFGYSYDDSIPKPFYYPVVGPAGRGLTRRHHARDLDGKAHEHHRSVWIEHMDVNHLSFETEDLELLHRFGGGGERITGIGRIHHRQFLRQQDGPVFAEFVTDAGWLGPSDAPLLEQTTEARLFDLPDRERVIDFVISLQAVADHVTFAETSFGGLAVRVASALEPGYGLGRIVNDAGGINEAGCHRSRSRWLDASGPVTADEWNGIAVFDHPANRGYPTGWHVRDDGWFCAAPSFLAPIELDAGERIELRYRILLHRGDAREGRVDARHEAYTNPPNPAWVGGDGDAES